MFTSATTSAFGKKLLLLGEAPGEEEVKAGQPFVGPSGKFLRNVLLPKAGWDFSNFTVANVVNTQPPRNLFKEFTLSKTDLKKAGLPILGPQWSRRHLLPEIYHESQATLSWIKAQNFDFIICLGGTALWLLTGDNRIGLFRGTIGRGGNGLPGFLATYHPAAILREYGMLPIAWADLRKAREHLGGTITPPLRRTFVYNPTWDEMERSYSYFGDRRDQRLGVDIETAPSIGQITTISFATPEHAICIPIWDKDAPVQSRNVYSTVQEEIRAWRMIERFAQLPNPKVLQNGLYDMQYLLDAAPFPIYLAGLIEDTNIQHHAFQPEFPKDLGMLASLYTNEPGWKQMRSKHQEEKAED